MSSLGKQLHIPRAQHRENIKDDSNVRGKISLGPAHHLKAPTVERQTVCNLTGGSESSCMEPDVPSPFFSRAFAVCRQLGFTACHLFLTCWYFPCSLPTPLHKFATHFMGNYQYSKNFPKADLGQEGRGRMPPSKASRRSQQAFASSRDTEAAAGVFPGTMSSSTWSLE